MKILTPGKILALGAILLSTAGCLGALHGGAFNQGATPDLVTKPLHEGSLPVETSAEEIQVIRSQAELPKGFFYYQDRKDGQARTKLFAIPNYPSSEAPHIVIAAMANRTRVYVNKQAMLREYKRAASEMGANAIYLPSGKALAFAIVTSAASAPAPASSVADLTRANRRSLKDFKPLGAASSLSLAKAEFLLDTKKAQCYAMSVVFNEGATLNDQAQNALYVSLSSNDPLLGNKSVIGPVEKIANPDNLNMSAPTNGRFVNMRSFTSKFGCASGSTKAKVALWTMGRSTVLGQGEVQVQLYQRRISMAELARKQKYRAASIEKARIATERFEREEAARAHKREAQRQERDRQRDARRASSAGTSASAAGSSTYSMSLKNECRSTVRLFIGDKPKYGSGRSTTVSSNSISSYSGGGSQTFWIVDASGNGISSYTASPGRNNVKILSSCSGFARR